MSNSELDGIRSQLYRPNAKVGSGSTAAAIRFERSSSRAVGGSFHSQKGVEQLQRLQRWLIQNPKASNSDRSAADSVLLDLKDALGI